MASRVVPGISDTIARSTPRSAFVILDFPTLGLPINAIFSLLSSSRCSSLFSGSTTLSRRSPVLLPFNAETPNGSPRPSEKNSNSCASCMELSHLLTANVICLPLCLSVSAISLSTGVRPSLPSQTKMMDCASSIARCACSRIALSKSSSLSGTIPPVSIKMNPTPLHSPRP